MSKKDRHVPGEVRAARKAKERRRVWTGFGFFALWWAMFLVSVATGQGWLLWASWLAISGEMIVVYGLHEKALRKIAGRPEVDYRQLHKTEKAEIKSRPPEIAD